MNEANREDIFISMKTLKLTGMIEAYDEVMAEVIKRKATTAYAVQQLLKAEVSSRQLKSMQLRLRTAKFPEHKNIDNFIFFNFEFYFS